MVELPPLVSPEEIYDIVKAFKQVSGDIKKASEYLGTLGKGKSTSRWGVPFAAAKKFGLLTERSDGEYEPTTEGYNIINYGINHEQSKQILKEVSSKYPIFAKALDLIYEELTIQKTLSFSAIGNLLRIKYNPKWSDSSAKFAGRAYSRWLEYFGLATAKKGEILLKEEALPKVEIAEEERKIADTAISALTPAVSTPTRKATEKPQAEIADIIFFLGKIDQLISSNAKVDEIIKNLEEIRNKLERIHPEGMTISEILLDYLKSQEKANIEYCSRTLNRLYKIILSRYFEES